MKYLKLRSWHIVRERTPILGSTLISMLCGQSTLEYSGPPNRPQTDELPLAEKSCETCLRIDKHKAEVR